MVETFIHPVKKVICRLGKRSARRNGKSHLRAARLSSFMSSLPSPPALVDNTKGITVWGMMLNDSLGDCTIACPGHLIQMWTASSGSEVTVPDSVILSAYEVWDGYIAGNPATDQGGDILTVIQDWQANGLGGYVITASAEITLNQLRLQQSVYVFGGANIGIQLPLSSQSQIGRVWDVTGDGKTGSSAPGSWGGHCVAVVGYNSTGPVVVTWGSLQQMTWAFFLTYVDEAHAIISPNFTGPIDATSMATDLQQIGS